MGGPSKLAFQHVLIDLTFCVVLLDAAVFRAVITRLAMHSVGRRPLKSVMMGCRCTDGLKLPSLSILQVGLIRNRSTNNVPVTVKELKANFDVAEVPSASILDRSPNVGERFINLAIFTHHL